MPKTIEGELPGQDRINASERVTVLVGPALMQYLRTRARENRRYVTEMTRMLLVDSMLAWYRERGIEPPRLDEQPPKPTRPRRARARPSPPLPPPAGGRSDARRDRRRGR